MKYVNVFILGILLAITSGIVSTNMTYPIEYKMIPTQYAFLVSADGTVKVQTMRELPSEKKFKSEKDARSWINSLKEII